VEISTHVTETTAKLKETLLRKGEDNQTRSEALYKYSEIRDVKAFEFLKELLKVYNDNPSFQREIIRAIGYQKSEKKEIDNYLLQLLNIEKFKDIAIENLARRGVDAAIPMIIYEILNSPDGYIRRSLGNYLRTSYSLSWEKRLDMLITEIDKQNIRPEAIDEEVIVAAIVDVGSSLTGNKDHIIENLIIRSIDQDRRMTGVYAKLIVELSSKSQSTAAQKISDVEKDHGIDSKKLKNLRIAIGGDTAIDSVMGILKSNLEKYFQTPIHELNSDTHKNWKKTIQYAQYGFMIRMIMSVVVFIVGILLLGLSSYEFFLGDKTGDELFGVGISFVAGLGTMLTVVYSGPLKQIRESVNDLGIASAAFIAYVHRVLEISHTFSYYYLNQKITFEEMDKSSELIDKAMKNTIKELSDKSAKL
jgi:hypothetical protein